MTTPSGSNSPAPGLSRAERLAALAVSLMLSVPFLLPVADLPIPSFYQEWLATLLGVTAFVLLAAAGNRIEMPALCLLPLALILIIVAHWLGGRLVFMQQGVLGVLYLAWACLMATVGSRLRDRLGSEGFAALVAWPLLLGASASALLGVLQYADWTPANWVLPARDGRVQGNLGQANHFADYLSLGLISAIFLVSTGRLARMTAAGAMLLILVAVSFSGSRTVVLYFLFLMFGVCYLRWRNATPVFGRATFWTAAAILVFVLVQLLGTFLPHIASGAAEPVAIRLIAGGDDHIRWRMWYSALLIAVEHPWLGAGFQSFAWQHFLLAPELAPVSVYAAADNAHNVLLHLLAEFGFVAALLCIATAIAWLIAQTRAAVSPGKAWLWAAVGILLLHSGLEYPLWYAYFLGLFCLLLGASWQRAWSLALARSGRVVTLGIAVGATLVLSQYWVDYRDLKRLSKPADAQRQENIAELRSRIVSTYQQSLLSHMLLFALANGAAVDSDNLDAKIALNSIALRILPTPETAYRQAMFLALSEHSSDAEKAWDQAVAAYPHRAEEMIRAIEADDRKRFSVLIEYARRKTGKTP